MSSSSEVCGVCKDTKEYTHWVYCEDCKSWFHLRCLGLPDNFASNIPEDVPFFCQPCLDKRQLDEPGSSEPLGDITSQENLTRHHQDTSTVSVDTEGDTDDEGYAEIESILDWKKQGRHERQFLVKFKKGAEKKWIKEADLNGCVTLLKLFCRRTGIEQTRIKYKSGCGSASPSEKTPSNWADVDEIIGKIISYGEKEGLTPSKFESLGDEDSLAILQVGEHAFPILYLSKAKKCFVADGENLFLSDLRTRKLVMELLAGAKEVHALYFNGQKRRDHCASSAAGIAIEFRRLHHSGQLDNLKDEIAVPESILKRISTVLHPVETRSIKSWRPIGGQQWKTECQKCGKQFNTKNRGALNIHKC